MGRSYEVGTRHAKLVLSLSGCAVGTTAEGVDGLQMEVSSRPSSVDKDVDVVAVMARNVSGHALEFEELALDLTNGVPMSGGKEVHIERDRRNVRHAGDAEDWYLLLPTDGVPEERLIVLPYDDTQLDLCEELPDGVFRCYLCATARRKAPEYEGVVWRQLPQALFFAPGEERRWIFLIATARTVDQVASVLLTYGKTPLGFQCGANPMRMVAHHFDDVKVDAHVNSQLVDDRIAATFTDGVLSQLTCVKGSIEVIAPDHPFGHASIHADDGRTLDTTDKRRFTSDDGSLCVQEDGLRLSVRFELKRGILRYLLEVANVGDAPVAIDDVRVPLPLNSDMGWDVDPAERMLRHSQVAGDNSFFLGVPANNKPPYLLCVPERGTAWEAFDHDVHGRMPSRGYALHLQGKKVAEDARRQVGGRWRLPVSSLELGPGESKRYAFGFQWVDGYDQANRALVEAGKVVIEAVPGLTVPRDQDLLLRLTGKFDDIAVEGEYADSTTVSLEHVRANAGDPMVRDYLFRVHMERLGENRLAIRYDRDQVGWLECFSTLPLEEVIKARADYIRECQTVDDSKWYDGLLCDRNTLTGEILDPNHHGQMPHRTRYSITCDDPALSRPAFLSSKNVEIPDAREIRALDRYCSKFVWGGLQHTDTEEYPYAVLGVPDWHDNRGRRNLNASEQLHIWRLYDYPHVALVWLNMYRIAKAHPGMTELDPMEYLRRAYGTYLAMYQYPFEVEQSYGWKGEISCQWNPYRTGFYSELAIVDAIEALRSEGMTVEARRLEFHWGHKADFFIRQAKDLFTSEGAFDTTGFETTQALVDWGRSHATALWNNEVSSMLNYTPAHVEEFDRRQLESNIACRGSIEKAYYLTGSDIRGDSSGYTLSYMSQMGGQALMQDALYAPGDPFKLLRLASTSLLSSWALVNAGDEDSDYGYWFSGKANNGASSGGFEPAPTAMTWLGQPSYRGVWRFGSETDLGYCGYLRGAATIVADDPDFGRVVYGGTMECSEDGEGIRSSVIRPLDGVARRFHVIRSRYDRIHMLAEGVRIGRIVLGEHGSETTFDIEFEGIAGDQARLKVFDQGHGETVFRVDGDSRERVDMPVGGIGHVRVVACRV